MSVGPHWAALALGAVALLALVAARLAPWLTGDANPVVFVHLTGSRLAAALLAGAGLGVAGAVLQGLTRNPLASPGILGVTSGAHFAIVLALAFAQGSVALIVAAFVGSVVAMVTAWSLAGPNGREGAALALSGVAVSLCLTACASALTILHDQRMAGAFVWIAGAPVEAGWAPVRELAPWALAAVVLAPSLARGLDVLALGGTMARGLGLTPGRLTALGFLIAGLAAGAAVALAGPVAFVGLLAPNALRRIGVQRHAWLLPLAALWGAVLLGAADWLADMVSDVGREIPPGAITAVVGAPAFLVLIAHVRGRGGAGAAVASSGRPRRWPLPVAVAVLAALAVVSLAVGETTYSPAVLWQLVTGEADAGVRFVLVELRLPRLLVAMAAGGLLALAGQALQGVLRNPLAGPETLGLIQGASLSALFALMAGAVPGGPVMQVAAFAGAIAAVGVVFAVAARSGLAPLPLVLAGIALAALLAALSSLVVLMAKLQAAQALVWLSGSVYARGWPALERLWPLAAMTVVAGAWLGPRLDVMGLGREKAVSLGLGIRRARVAACALAAAATAAAVSVAGSIAFVGLLGPHLGRLLYAGGFRGRLPMTIACGAGLTAFADFVGRTAVAPIQLPVGIMTSLVGAPYFLWLLRRSRS